MRVPTPMIRPPSKSPTRPPAYITRPPTAVTTALTIMGDICLLRCVTLCSYYTGSVQKGQPKSQVEKPKKFFVHRNCASAAALCELEHAPETVQPHAPIVGLSKRQFSANTRQNASHRKINLKHRSSPQKYKSLSARCPRQSNSESRRP